MKQFANYLIQFVNFFDEDKQNNEVYIMMEARLEALFRSEDEYQVLEKWVVMHILGINFMYCVSVGCVHACFSLHLNMNSSMLTEVSKNHLSFQV